MSASTGMASGLKGTGYRQFNVPTKGPEQMNLFRDVAGRAQPGIGSGVDFLSQLAQGDPSLFDKLEAPALRQFGQLQGNIASRFSGMGSGARHSSGFQNTVNAAGQSLSESLAAQRMGYQSDAVKQLLGLYQELMGEEHFNTGLVPKKKKWWEELLGGLSGGIGHGLGVGAGMGGSSFLGLLG